MYTRSDLRNLSEIVEYLAFLDHERTKDLEHLSFPMPIGSHIDIVETSKFEQDGKKWFEVETKISYRASESYSPIEVIADIRIDERITWNEANGSYSRKHSWWIFPYLVLLDGRKLFVDPEYTEAGALPLNESAKAKINELCTLVLNVVMENCEHCARLEERIMLGEGLQARSNLAQQLSEEVVARLSL